MNFCKRRILEAGRGLGELEKEIDRMLSQVRRLPVSLFADYLNPISAGPGVSNVRCTRQTRPKF